MPRWIAIGTGSSRSVLLFDRELSHADTIPVELSPGRAGRIANLLFPSGGDALLVGVADAVVRLRLADRRPIDYWAPTAGTGPTTSTLLADARTLLVAATRMDDAAPAPETLLWFVTADRAWTAERIPGCLGIPVDFAVFEEGARAYLACRGYPNVIVEIDLRLRRIVRSSSEPLAACYPTDLGFSRSGTILYVLCSDSGTLLFLDRVTLAPLDSIVLGSGVTSFETSPTRPEAVLLSGERNQVTVFDLERRALRSRILLPAAPAGMALSGDGEWAYVTIPEATDRSGLLLRIDLDRGETVAAVPIPRGSTAIAIWPGSRTPVLNWR